ncbi:MAG: helix-turn-helix domain-containing protein [Petrimonas sp.]|nr:helix-turn-helix domain-containing protein [Petrimonas sp.]
MEDTQLKNDKEKEVSRYLLTDVASCTFTFSDGLSSRMDPSPGKEIVLVKLIPHTAKSKIFAESVFKNYVHARNMNGLAKLCGYDCTKTFMRHFKKYFGQTPYQWMLDRKMEEIWLLVENSELTITEIAGMCGFKSVSHLVSLYSRRYGVPPLKSRTIKSV